MSTEWFCKIMGDEWGPMSSQELYAVARRGRLTRDDLVRKGAEGAWVRADVVKGLFNNMPAASTATSHRVAIDNKQPLPAKRSVREIRAKQYWLKAGLQIAGPYSSSKIRQLAAVGQIRPYDLISEDQHHWVRASQVRSLSFGGANAKASTASIRSAVWLIEPLPESADAQTLSGHTHVGEKLLLVSSAT